MTLNRFFSIFLFIKTLTLTLILTLYACSLNSAQIKSRTIDKLTIEEAINYNYNLLTIQGSTETDTMFIETYSSASFMAKKDDAFIGYRYVIQDSLIHPHFNVPLKTVYHYNGAKLTTAIISSIHTSLKEEELSDINQEVFSNVMQGQLPAIISILQNPETQTLKDTIINDVLCAHFSVVKDGLRSSLFVSKETFFPVMLRIITNTFQPFIEEYYYRDFSSSDKLIVPDYRSEFESKSTQKQFLPYKVGDIFPDVELHDLSGNQVGISKSNRYKIIYISMINCGPCQRAVPYIEDIYENFKGNDFADFYVFYPMDLKEKLEKYVATKNIKTPIVYNSISDEAKRIELSSRLRTAFPSVLILNEENYIKHIINSFSTDLERRIKERLDEESFN